MQIIHGLNKIKKLKNPVVALGVFDGVHLGHREILKAAIRKARQIKGESVVLTFWPHPQKEESLYSMEHRLRLIAELGADYCIVVNFSPHFTKIKPDNFVKDILAKKIAAKYVYAGENYKFGRNAKGDIAGLKRLGKTYGFKTRGFRIIRLGSKQISSTLIRKCIRSGSLKKAQKLLGRPVSILGTVIKGSALGRIIGFPTANINPHHEVIPPEGIYAVRIILEGRKLKGACYIGRRPTIIPRDKKASVEVYIFDFKKDIYDKLIEIQFVKKIRCDKKFSTINALAIQIKKDISSAKRILS